MPDEVPTGDLTGSWTARTGGQAEWRLELEQDEQGKLEGSGTVTRGGESLRLSARGIRDEYSVSLDLGAGTFEGSILGIDQLIGLLLQGADTIPITFERQERP